MFVASNLKGSCLVVRSEHNSPLSNAESLQLCVLGLSLNRWRQGVYSSHGPRLKLHHQHLNLEDALTYSLMRA